MKTCCLNPLVVEKWLKCSLMIGIALHDYMSVCWNLHVLYQVQVIILWGRAGIPPCANAFGEIKTCTLLKKKKKILSISNEKFSVLPQT